MRVARMTMRTTLAVSSHPLVKFHHSTLGCDGEWSDYAGSFPRKHKHFGLLDKHTREWRRKSMGDGEGTWEATMWDFFFALQVMCFFFYPIWRTFLSFSCSSNRTFSRSEETICVKEKSHQSAADWDFFLIILFAHLYSYFFFLQKKNHIISARVILNIYWSVRQLN